MCLDGNHNADIRQILITLPSQLLNHHIFRCGNHDFCLQFLKIQSPSACETLLIMWISSQPKQFDLELRR